MFSPEFWKYARLNVITVCSYHVTYAFQSESTLYSCLNVKELLARNRHEIWNLSDCNGIRTHRGWIHSETRTWRDKNIQSNAPYRQVLTTQLNHLASWAKWLNVRFRTKWLWVRVSLLSFKAVVWKPIYLKRTSLQNPSWKFSDIFKKH